MHISLPKVLSRNLCNWGLKVISGMQRAEIRQEISHLLISSSVYSPQHHSKKKKKKVGASLRGFSTILLKQQQKEPVKTNCYVLPCR